MKKRSTKIISSALLAIPFAAALIPHFAFAGTTTAAASFFGLTFDNTVWQLTALLTELGMAIAGSLVTITGALLNATMTATLNMAAIVDNTPAVGVAWTTIRDFGSMFIIFMLLDASIKIILGIGSDAGKLIKNIIIAGLLINFSLFFTKLAVDTSNIISLSFYNAIAPTGLGQTNTTTNSSTSGAGSLVGLVSTAFDDGGLSNVFMQSLDLQSIASASSSAANQSGDKFWNITLANIGGSILMSFAAISFLAAAVAFAVRIGVLILLMAFSPIYFIGMIFPDVQEYSKRWLGMLYSMCVFMPVYLILMYVAMSVLNDPHFFDFASAQSSTTNITNGAVGSLIGPNLIGIVMQYIIAILLINAPLFAAISIAGKGADFIGNLMKNVSKWGQGAIQSMGKGAWRESGGRAAAALSQNQTFRDFAGKSIVGELALKSTRGVAADYNKTSEKRKKSKEEFADSLGFDENKMAASQSNIRNINAQIAQVKAAGASGGLVHTILKGRLETERQKALDIETARKKSYAQRTEADTTSVGGLYNHIARSNRAASAKVSISVIEKQMKRSKEDLAENKTDLKQIENAIKNTIYTDPRTGVVGQGNPAQLTERQRLLDEVRDETKKVTDYENRIEQLKLVK